MLIKSTIKELKKAESKAAELFLEIERRKIIQPNITEKALNKAIYDLAKEMFGIEKYWHKRIVRAGKNTLHPYDANPENLLIKTDDILFLDFGPIFDTWEADFGRTYVLGNDPHKLKLKNDIETAWKECRDYYFEQKEITGAALYEYAVNLAKKYGWEFGGEIAGHLIGKFPHEKLEKEDKRNYIHPENQQSMLEQDESGNERYWILEIHFVDKGKEIGGFFEQLLI